MSSFGAMEQRRTNGGYICSSTETLEKKPTRWHASTQHLTEAVTSNPGTVSCVRSCSKLLQTAQAHDKGKRLYALGPTTRRTSSISSIWKAPSQENVFSDDLGLPRNTRPPKPESPKLFPRPMRRLTSRTAARWIASE